MTKTSEWEGVRKLMEGIIPVILESQIVEWFIHSPRSLCNYLSYYKFCAKMIGSHKKVLHSNPQGCFGTYLLQVECGYALSLVKTSIERESLEKSGLGIKCILEDSLSSSTVFEAIVHLGMQEDILSLIPFLVDTGLLIVGVGDFSTPLENNLEEAKQMENLLQTMFEFVFAFSAQNERIEMGIIPQANFYFFIGSKRK